jgi:hypothetical protein
MSTPNTPTMVLRHVPLVLSMLCSFVPLLHPFDRTNNTRSIDTQMTGDLCGRGAQLFPAAIGNNSPRRAYATSLSSGFQFYLIYLPVPAFRIYDLLDRLSASLVFGLAQLAVFGFFEYGSDEFSPAQYPLVIFFLLPPSAHGHDL